MNRIRRIGRLQDFGVFRDFTWPENLPEFARYNLIYGWNWSGKTTLSRLFCALENRSAPPEGEVTVTVDGGQVRNPDFGQVTVPIRVFNRDFVIESVFPAEGDVAPIFILGKQNVEKQKKVDQLKVTLAEHQIKLRGNRKSKDDADAALDKFCIDKAKVVKETLRSGDSHPYNTYDKKGFAQRAQDMVSAGDKGNHELDEAVLKTVSAQHRATRKSKLPMLAHQLPAFKGLAGIVADLLTTTVVSNAIQSLKDDAKLSSWVRAGLGLHGESDGVRCLFCNLPMPKDRLAALEAHFDTEHVQLIKSLDDQIQQIQEQVNAIDELNCPKSVELLEDLVERYEAAEYRFERARRSARGHLESLIEIMTDKKGRAFERVTFRQRRISTLQERVDRLNGIILEHNKACDDLQSRIDTARKRLVAGWVAANLEEFVRFRGAVQEAMDAVKSTASEVKRLDDEIARLEREIEEHRKPADDLNKDLRSYLGHDELRLETKSTGYAVMRGDTPAKELSEGEMTAIALLYFLKFLEDHRFDLKKGVVVLDDPVSSLDANALYFAFGFIKERTQDACQLIILTHNFTFFRQVRNWYCPHINQQKSDVNKRPYRFYMVECTHAQDGRRAAIGPLDELLEKYESEYHYLFARIRREVMAAPSASLEQNYALPNIARRLLETFLAFRLPHVSGLSRQLEQVAFDAAKKTRILRFVHTHSHGDAIGEPEHDPSILSEAQSILKDVLEMIESEDKNHYSAMVSLVPASTSGDELEPGGSATPAQ